MGPFRFDFSRQIASFNEQVLLSQLHPQGQLDQLRCEKLSVYFTRDQPSTATHDPRGKLAPGSIEILGTDSLPVVLNAPSQEATARCQRMRIELGPQRVTFDQGHQVALTYQGNEIHAKQVQYQAPPKDSDQRIGKLLAAGRGWFRARTSDEKGAEPFEVRWLENMHLRRINGLPVLSLNGRPQLDMVGMGKLWADHIDLYLRESATDGSEADLLPSDIVPERLVAGGQIAIDSAQLHGKVKELKVRFEYVPSDLMLNGPSSSNPRTGAITIRATRIQRRARRCWQTCVRHRRRDARDVGDGSQSQARGNQHRRRRAGSVQRIIKHKFIWAGRIERTPKKLRPITCG